VREIIGEIERRMDQSPSADHGGGGGRGRGGYPLTRPQVAPSPGPQADPTVRITLRVNGGALTLAVDQRTSLLDALREHAGTGRNQQGLRPRCVRCLHRASRGRRTLDACARGAARRGACRSGSRHDQRGPLRRCRVLKTKDKDRARPIDRRHYLRDRHRSIEETMVDGEAGRIVSTNVALV
jgi:hypothetical protein